MKKFIKDWWPVLLIAAVALWKNHQNLIKTSVSLPINAGIEEGAYAGDCYECGCPTYYQEWTIPNPPFSKILKPICSNPDCQTRFQVY